MRHKWKKRNFSKSQVYRDSTEAAHLRDVRIYDTKECAYCGLRKGYSKDYGFFPKIVYFIPEKVLSVDKIPFSCNSEWIGGSLPINRSKVVFICEDEFKV